MDLLRNKGKLTRMLVLAGIVIEGRTTVNSIAGSVGITPQGVSEYLAQMGSEGLVARERGKFRATVAGVESLQSSLLALKAFVDHSIGGLDIVRSTDAIAGCDLMKGDRVGLFMRRGLLYASKEVRGSWGIAESDASTNEMVQVASLTGVVEMERSPIRFVIVPPARTGGGGSKLDPRRLRTHVQDALGIPSEDLVTAALDMEGAALLLRSGITCDLEMPDAGTLVGYHERGRHVLAFGTPYSVSVMEESLSKMRPGGCSERDVRLAPV